MQLTEMKLPAALLMITFGRPNLASHASKAALTASGLRTSICTGKTGLPVWLVISPAVVSNKGSRLENKIHKEEKTFEREYARQKGVFLLQTLNTKGCINQHY